MAVSGRSQGATAAGHGLDDDWMGDDWMAFTRNYGPGDSDSRQLAERATEKRNPAGQVEYGWSPARARRAPLLELEHDWMRPVGVMTGWVMTGWLST